MRVRCEADECSLLTIVAVQQVDPPITTCTSTLPSKLQLACPEDEEGRQQCMASEHDLWPEAHRGYERQHHGCTVVGQQDTHSCAQQGNTKRGRVQSQRR
eukprot:1148904-Pelagomonas_calceolata.AAC.2